MRARRAVTATGGLVGALLVGGAVVGLAGTTRQSTAGEEPAGAPMATATVERRDLVERTELSGTLGHGPVRPLELRGAGTLTALPEAGAVIERGGTMAEIDGRPVPLLYGDRPLWRPVGPDTDDGADVRIVEENLIALGYATEASLGPNERMSQATVAAIKRLQADLGLTEDGVLDPGDVVVQDGPVRVAEVTATVGAQAGGPALTVSGSERLVSVDLDARRQTLVTEGDPVEVVLPDGSTAAGTVRRVGRVATAPDSAGMPGGGGPVTVDLEIDLDDPAAGGTLDQAPVTVRVTTSSAEAVLAVPVGALLALAEGGYAVERVTGAGTELAGISLGRFADGWVEVTGAVVEGDEVVVPS